MHTVMWTFKVPAGTPKAQLVETINATAHTYEGIPGLIRKYYGIACAEPFIRSLKIELTGHDYYVYNRADGPFSETTGLQVLLSAPVSGIILAK